MTYTSRPPAFSPTTPAEPRSHYGQRIALYIARHATCAPFSDSDLELASAQTNALFDKASPEVVALLNDVKSMIRLSLKVRAIDRLATDKQAADAAVRPALQPPPVRPSDGPQGGAKVPLVPKPLAPAPAASLPQPLFTGRSTRSTGLAPLAPVQDDWSF